jgi:ribosomal protein L37AE/L43A
MAISARLRSPTECIQCGTLLITPEWSETVNSGQAVHIWRCPVCEYEFETIDNVVEPMVPVGELIQEFLPNLVVA